MAASTTSATKMATSGVVVRRLYRSLLRTAKPYSSPSPNAAVLNSLLHRTGNDDHLEEHFLITRQTTSKNIDNDSMDNHEDTDLVRTARDLSYSYAKEKRGEHDSSNMRFSPNSRHNKNHEILFRRLLHEVVGGKDNDNNNKDNDHGKSNKSAGVVGRRRMSFPSQVDTTILRQVIQREFKNPTTTATHNDDTRRQVAFIALRELNKKLSYFDTSEQSAPIPHPNQAAIHVSSLPCHSPSSYLRPGAFLISHPHMQDSFFARTVICILSHNNGYDDDDNNNNNNNDNQQGENSAYDKLGGTYGLIVNRVSVNRQTGKNRTLKEALHAGVIPKSLVDAFGDSVVRDGGPVHASIQMLYTLSSEKSIDETNGSGLSLGGTMIPIIPDNNNESAALYSDKATYYQADIIKAAIAIKEGKIDQEDISIFLGASCWSPGQLENEVAQGYWLPCRGPPEIAVSGMCEHPVEASTTDKKSITKEPKRPIADLWLSMLSACGKEEAKLAHLIYNNDENTTSWDPNSLPCDAPFFETF